VRKWIRRGRKRRRWREEEEVVRTGCCGIAMCLKIGLKRFDKIKNEVAIKKLKL
jgi:hypothetical protein